MDRERPFRVRQRAVVRSTDSGNSYKLVYLIGKGETPLRRGRGVADRLHRSVQAGENFGGEKQSLRCSAWLYSPMPLRQDRDTTGVYSRSVLSGTGTTGSVVKMRVP